MLFALRFVGMAQMWELFFKLTWDRMEVSLHTANAAAANGRISGREPAGMAQMHGEAVQYLFFSSALSI